MTQSGGTVRLERSTFPLLLAGHLIGDWIVQTDWQAANKTTSWKANQQHVIGYHLTLAAFVAGKLSMRQLVWIVFASWVTHSIIDRRWPVKWLMRHTGSAPFSETTFGVIAVDQALHLSILALLSTAQTGRS
jgi:hypothetical protein